MTIKKTKKPNGCHRVLTACFACGLTMAFATETPTRVADLTVNRLVMPGHVVGVPTFAWRMDTSRPGAKQTAYRLRVMSAPRGVAPRTLWDSGTVTDERSTGIVYAGQPLASARRYIWTVDVKDERGIWTESAAVPFTTGLRAEDWAGAQWIAPAEKGPYNLRTAGFRRTFTNPKAVTEAWWTVTAAGVFEIYANGLAVTDEFLKPGFTHVLKARQACTYDVTDKIDRRPGAVNILAAAVSPAWSRDRIANRSRRWKQHSELAPTLRAVLVLRHADGTETRILTDDAWRAALDCHPVRTSGIYEGETVDARVSLDWLAGAEPDWAHAVPNTQYAAAVRSFRGPPVRLREDLAMKPRSVYVVKGARNVAADRHGTANIVRRGTSDFAQPLRLEPGEMLVLDFGQNASAVPEFEFDAAAGVNVEIRHGEMLNDQNGEKARGNDGPAGTPYLANLRSSYAGVKYITRNGPAKYRAQFTFFGYRYVHVTADGPLTVRAARSLPVTSVQPGQDKTAFKTDNPRINRLLENCRWGMYSNYLSVPTDCPQRDERVGWTADTQVFAPAAAYLADIYAFLDKWMADMRDSQRPDGCYPWVAPEPWTPGYTIGWTDAGVIVPYILWRRYGDAATVRENWDSMTRYMDYVAKNGDKDQQPFGDWLSYEYGADMEWLKPSRNRMQLPRKRVLSYAYRVWTARMMAEMAQMLGRTNETARYRARERADTAAFRAFCLTEAGTLLPECDGQCSALYALYLDLLPTPTARDITRRALRANFRAHGDCLQTGFLGTAILLDAVTFGMNDPALAYTLLLQDKNPSWLYSVDQGATTIWERWNSYTKADGFGPVDMNSFNHYAYGAVANWMFTTIAGIRDDASAPGFRRFILAPLPDTRIGSVDAVFPSPYGTIRSAWKYAKDGSWEWTFTIPANTTASVIPPGGKPKTYVAGTYSLRLPPTPKRVTLENIHESWTFDDLDPSGIKREFISNQSPARIAKLNEAFLTGVPGVEKHGLWCLPGAAGRLTSAMIVPSRENFTLTFYAGFPAAPAKRVSIASNPKMSLFFTPDGAFTAVLGKKSVTARAPVADGKWHHYALMRRDRELSIWIDGVRQAVRTDAADTTYDSIAGLEAQWKLLAPENTDRLFFDELFVFNRAVAPDTLRALAARAAAATPPAVTREEERETVARVRRFDPPLATEKEYVPLTIKKDDLRPFAEQHDVRIMAVPWFDETGRDLICQGTIFGSRPLLYRFLRHENGAPVYAEGIPYTGPELFNAIPRTGPDGTFGIFRITPPNRMLVYYRFDRATRTFGKGETVCDTHDLCYTVPNGRIALGDLDGDGVDDLLIGRACPENGPAVNCINGFPWPKKGNCPWTNVETPYSGIGRGYDVFGNWLGAENVMEVLWSKGFRDNGRLRFAEMRPVYVDMPDFPRVKRALTWKMHMHLMGLAAYGAPSGRHLALFGDMNRIASFRVSRVKEDDVYCGLPQPLLASGYTAPHNYWINAIHPVDLDGDGRKELLLDGNPGTVGVLKGIEPGSWTSTRAMIQGGAICGETLSAAARFDWDHDGRADILLTDASGWMTFWGGTDDPLVYRGARPFTVNGRPFCLKGGDSGSLQGKVERVWGYVKIIAGRWGNADALVTTDIRGDLLLHRRADGDDPLALAPAQPFRHPNGRPFKVAWRSRPDFVPAGFAGIPHPSLLIMDVDGDAAVAVPESDGSLVLADVRKLTDADGLPIRLCGKNGLWGRGHLELVDWDGDGKEDIIFGTNQTCQKYFCKQPIKETSTPFLFKNIGTREKPRFAEPAPFRFTKNGNRLAFGCHNATPWATDLDGDGRPDLLVSAENGKVYAFRHDEISPDGAP